MSGRQNEIGRRKRGKLEIGINSPQRKSIGKRKKFEKVCASKTCLADTAINSPVNDDVMAISKTASKSIPQLTALKSIKKLAKMTGTNALKIPNRIVPAIFASTMRFKLIGASSNRSNDLPLRSKVIVTASMEVVPNRTLMEIRPGSNSRILPSGERMSCISDHERGKMIPQLMFGGFK